MTGTRLQERVNGALSLMQYNLAPEITASSLSISGGDAGTTGLSMAAVGGGFTWSKSFPLYLEGNLGYTRYDPTFILSDGTETRQVPVKWNSLAGTVGIGWDFPLARELTLRPMANFSLGRVTSDIVIAGRLIESETGQEIEFLDNGHLDAVGYGGSVILDYEHYREMYEVDVETRLTNIWLESLRRHVGGGAGVGAGGERGGMGPMAGAHRSQGARPTGSLCHGIRVHVLFRAQWGHVGFQPPHVPRGRPGARHQSVRQDRHAVAPDGPVSLRSECHRVVGRFGNEFLGERENCSRGTAETAEYVRTSNGSRR